MKTAMVAFWGISALLAVGNALQCHLCIGSLSSDCMVNTESAAANATCPNFDELSGKAALQFSGMKGQLLDTNKKTVTKCAVMTVRETSAVSALVQRGCGYIYEDTDLCEFLQSQQPEIDTCMSCDTDYCNLK